MNGGGERRPGAIALAVVVAVSFAAGCRHSRRARTQSFVPPPLQAGFVEREGPGWRVAVPSTWQAVSAREHAAWEVADPQTAQDFHANASVVAEPYPGDTYDYARANEAALRRERRAGVEAVREDVVDGDPTLLIESRWAPAAPSAIEYRTMQAALASRGSGYVVTCAVAAVAFERYRATCESILRSFAVER